VERTTTTNTRVAIRARERRANRVLARRRLVHTAMFPTLSTTLRIVWLSTPRSVRNGRRRTRRSGSLSTNSRNNRRRRRIRERIRSRRRRTTTRIPLVYTLDLKARSS
jgi:hypothetical protein